MPAEVIAPPTSPRDPYGRPPGRIAAAAAGMGPGAGVPDSVLPVGEAWVRHLTGPAWSAPPEHSRPTAGPLGSESPADAGPADREFGNWFPPYEESDAL
jgi:hypothetical protein